MELISNFLRKIKINNIFITIFFALLYAFSFSPYNFFIGGIIAFIYVFYLYDKKRSLFHIYLFFFISYIIQISWLLNVRRFSNDLFFLGFFLMVSVLAFFNFLPFYIGNKLNFNLYKISFLWIISEYIRQFSILSFPWLFLGYMLNFSNIFLQTSDLWGIWGISLFLFLFLSGLYYSIFKFSRSHLYITLFIFTFFLIYGIYREYIWTISEEKSLNVAVLQPNIPQEKKWKRNFKDSTYIIFNSLIDKTKSKTKKNINFILWPETASPSYLFYTRYDYLKVKNIVRKSQTYNIIGALRLKNEKDDYKYYNSLFVFDKNFKLIDYYDKVILVPFGEYVPFSHILGFLNKFHLGISNFSSGDKEKLLRFNNINISPLICFEAIFPFYNRLKVKKGANFIITVSNDAWFGKNEIYQHFDMARLRAIETRRYLIRSGNVGISAIVDYKGKVIKSIPPYVRDVLIGEVKLISYNSIYTKYGDFIFYISLIFSIFFLFKSIIKGELLNNEKN